MPGFLVTTSRAPSPRTRSFVKDLVSLLPGAVKVNRGHLTLEELAISAASQGIDRVVVVGERKGNPSIIRVYEVAGPGAPSPVRNIVTMLVAGLSLSRELGRPAPSKPEGLLVADPGDPELDEFVEAWMRGFRARLLTGRPPRRSVVVLLRRGDRGVVAEFEQDGRLVGPRLRLARPRKMVKGPDEGWLTWLG